MTFEQQGTTDQVVPSLWEWDPCFAAEIGTLERHTESLRYYALAARERYDRNPIFPKKSGFSPQRYTLLQSTILLGAL
jgi:hypothetical protein